MKKITSRGLSVNRNQSMAISEMLQAQKKNVDGPKLLLICFHIVFVCAEEYLVFSTYSHEIVPPHGY